MRGRRGAGALNYASGAECRANSAPKLTAFLQYACLLVRDAEQWERNYWANLMSATMTVSQVFYDFVSSAHFGPQTIDSRQAEPHPGRPSGCRVF